MRKKSRTIGNFPIYIIRLVAPFFILLSPFWMGIVCLLLDAIDVILIDIFRLKKFKNYKIEDRILDTYYLAFECIVVFSWPDGFAKILAISLFAFRAFGVALLIVTGIRKVLVVFSNIFEYYFLFYAYFFYVRNIEISVKTSVIVVLILIPIKLVQEWILHSIEFHPWEYAKKKILKVDW